MHYTVQLEAMPTTVTSPITKSADAATMGKYGRDVSGSPSCLIL